MRKLKTTFTVVIGLLAAAIGAALIAAPPANAASLREITNFGTNPTALRMYVYVPDGLPAGSPLIVAPHYCHGTGPEFFNGSGLATLADRYKFAMIFPSVTQASDQCFDVASPAALKRGGGSDPVGIMAMVDYAKRTYGIDPQRIFSYGVSSGAMMTNVLLADYPDVFKAGAAFAGVPYTCFAGSSSWSTPCASGQVTKTAQQWGDAVRNNNPGYTGPWPRIMLWHGTNDETLNYHNFGEEIKQWTNVHGLSQTPSSTDNVGNNVTRTRYNDSRGYTRVEAYSMAGVTHNLPTDPAAAIRFFGLDGTATPPPVTGQPTTTPATPPTTTGSPTQAPNGYPYCVNGSASDPDGDGWGWENNASCVVRGSAADPGRTTPTTTRATTPPVTTTRPTTVTTAPPVTTAAGGTGTCSATFAVSNAWNGGFVAAVTIGAPAAIRGWTVTMTLPSGTTVTNSWNGTFTGTTGTVTVRDAGWNGPLPAGGSTSFGFQGTGSPTGVQVTCAAT